MADRHLRIAITGSRGIPNQYGGFEQCAERLSVLLSARGHMVSVYNPHDHPYSSDTYQGVRIIKRYHPEKKIGTAANFLYDYLCMRHALRSGCDILLVLGYTTASIFNPILRRRGAVMVTNMDGLEWKRDKWSKPVKALIRSLEALGARYGGHLISDHPEIRRYLLDTYGRDSTCIAYGADPAHRTEAAHLDAYGLQSGAFDLIIARLERENHIEMILDGVVSANSNTPTLVVGKHHTAYGDYLKEKYSAYSKIQFAGGIYSPAVLDSLRACSRYYFHGHSVGGTNPSLLEAMAAGAFIVAHDNAFNRGVLGDEALYFATSRAIHELLENPLASIGNRQAWIEIQQEKIRREYTWEHIAAKYERLFLSLSGNRNQ